MNKHVELAKSLLFSLSMTSFDSTWSKLFSSYFVLSTYYFTFVKVDLIKHNFFFKFAFYFKMLVQPNWISDKVGEGMSTYQILMTRGDGVVGQFIILADKGGLDLSTFG